MLVRERCIMHGCMLRNAAVSTAVAIYGMSEKTFKCWATMLDNYESRPT
jgi:hypothetical protein